MRPVGLGQRRGRASLGQPGGRPDVVRPGQDDGLVELPPELAVALAYGEPVAPQPLQQRPVQRRGHVDDLQPRLVLGREHRRAHHDPGGRASEIRSDQDPLQPSLVLVHGHTAPIARVTPALRDSSARTSIRSSSVRVNVGGRGAGEVREVRCHHGTPADFLV